MNNNNNDDDLMIIGAEENDEISLASNFFDVSADSEVILSNKD